MCAGRLATCSSLYNLPKLAGTIPPQIGGLTNLTSLYACGSCAVQLDIPELVYHSLFEQRLYLSMHSLKFDLTLACAHVSRSVQRLYRFTTV